MTGVGMIRNWLVSQSLKQVLKKNSPNSIPLSGEDRLRGRNYYSVRMLGKNEPAIFLLNEYYKKGVTGRYWIDRNDDGSEASLLAASFHFFRPEITQYYGAAQITYNSFIGYLFGRYSFRAGWLLIGNKIRQWRFNRRTLVRNERYALLSKIYEETVDDRTYTTSEHDLLTSLYGMQVYGHPGYEEVLNHNGLLLASLSEAGDLNRAGTRFSLTGRALTTLGEYEEANRKHRESVNIQRTLAALTFGLIIVGLIQVFTE